MQRKTLNDVFSSWTTAGIFSAFDTFEVPWRFSDVTNSNLDLLYHGWRSGDKFISPLVNRLLNSSGELSPANVSLLAGIIFDKYNTQWSKLWDTLSLEYDPISNYNMTETESTNGNASNSVHNAVNGFNSSSAVDSDNQTASATSSGQRALTRSGNIGVTTSQQMLQSERDLWMWSYFDVVFADIDKLLCLSIY